MKTIQELLDLSNEELLTEAREAYWGLMGGGEPSHCINPEMRVPNPIYGECIKCNDTFNLKECKRERSGLYTKSGCSVENPIPHPIEKVAFQMRNACDFVIWSKILYTLTEKPWGNQSRALKLDARHWVIAACKAWRI